MFQIRSVALLAMIGLLLSGNMTTSWGCPFCSAVSQTFSEEMTGMDVVAVCQLAKAASLDKLNTSDPQAEVPKSQFRIIKVIKGSQFIKEGDTFDTVYFGEAKMSRPFLAMATDAPNLMWSTPLILSDRAKDYLMELPGLSKGGERLEFFQNYLEDEDEMLARDAYDEFAKAPYKDVIALKEKMKHDQLLKFIQDSEVPSNRRRLYFTMLGVCGTESDADLLEQLMASKERKDKAGLDAMLACYVILKGADGLERVDKLFLRNKDAEYADTYAAIMAIRFHGSEVDVVPKKRLIQSLRHMLDRPELADLVIPDLARWKDWEVMPRLIDLFVDADENSSWVRVPVINFLRACPDPEAQAAIERLKQVDPEAVKRAMTFFPLGTETKSSSEAVESADSESKPNPPAPETTGSVGYLQTKPTSLLAADEQEEDHAVQQGVGRGAESATPPAGPEAVITPSEDVDFVTEPQQETSAVKKDGSVARVDTPDTLKQAELMAQDGANLWIVFAVTLTGGGLYFAAMRSVLGMGKQG